jgi:hypothetical protein
VVAGTQQRVECELKVPAMSIERGGRRGLAKAHADESFHNAVLKAETGVSRTRQAQAHKSLQGSERHAGSPFNDHRALASAVIQTVPAGAVSSGRWASDN